MTRVLLVVTVVLACVFACGDPAPCTPADKVMAIKQAECIARVRIECPNIPDDECPVVRECDAWGAARCGDHGGTGGAP